ncbi:MAG: polysaccharide deacetylase family protein [Bacillota bacterium]|uniref:Polysaccharide deacetylase family protein n=1 Tax=Thermanaerosceptrum fracticalcis TaxID=1712410 RepID=A0A7G6E7D8_THEFR|nr:polysaccharide deacetylase family protein [Thermanaerosceptrum fracticalcis]QNB47992.1 polysaccharide deacetylase family protein [Thermanaerosceptrum fracticalcis]
MKAQKILQLFLVLSFIGVILVAGPGAFAQEKGASKSFAVPVLIYHHFAPPGLNIHYNNAVLTPEQFETQMRYLVENHYNVISLRDLAEAMEKGQALPPKTLVITMDDGYESNYVYVFPILKKYNIKATINLIVSYIKEEHPVPFNPEITTYLTWKQIEEMKASGLIDFQSHTFNQHYYGPVDEKYRIMKPALTTPLYKPEENRRETKEEYRERVLADLKKAKDLLEERLGTEVFALAYPYGAYNHEVQALARKAGYKMQLSVKNGLNRYGDTLTAIKRVNISPGDDLNGFKYRIAKGKETRSKKLDRLLKMLNFK